MAIKYEINNFDLLDEAMEVAEKVFKPSEEEKLRYHNKNVWSERVKNGFFILAKAETCFVGFAICYPKDGGLHIWKVGVIEEYRKQGIWQSMYRMIINYAKERKYKFLTLNTFPEDFGNMYKFTMDNGFAETDRELDKESNKTKVFLKKNLEIDD